MATFLCEILIIFLAYILGSIPFGYLITRFSAKKNILEIGWKKTSGSNVFKHIGKLPGILTGLLDVAKGFLAIWLAQKFGFGLYIQVLVGVAVVVGHNWSIFLKGAGGRGIGAFIGVFFVFSPQILGVSLIPFLILALIWNAAIGTILFLLTSLVLSFYFSQVAHIGIFVLLCLIPIFLKRLSPISEIKTASNKKALIKNRLLFDNDHVQGFRLKKLLKYRQFNMKS